MENIIKITSAAEFTRQGEIAGVYYTSLPSEDGSALARITLVGSDDVFETTHAIAKEIELVEFPIADRKPPVKEEAE